MCPSRRSEAPGASGRVVTFYSYKGGVGRTMAVANVAVQLALWGHRVLAVDMDLEAPGLDEFFGKRLAKVPMPRMGLARLFAEFDSKRPVLKWRMALRKVRLSSQHSVSLLSAGPRDPSYATRVQAIDWDKLYEAGAG